jgi:hypothetical protein
MLSHSSTRPGIALIARICHWLTTDPDNAYLAAGSFIILFKQAS